MGKSKTKKKLPAWAIIPILVVLIGVVAIVAQLIGNNSSKSMALDAVKVKKGDVTETYSVKGMTQSDKTKVFYSPVNAPISKLHIKVGQTVKKGDLLVEFDTTNLERDNKQSELTKRQTQLANQDAIDSANQMQESSKQAEAKAVQAAQDAYNDLAKQQGAIANQMRALEKNVNDEKVMNANNQSANAAAQAYIQALDATVSYNQDRIAEINQLIEGGADSFTGKTYSIKNYTNYQPQTGTFGGEIVNITDYNSLSVWANNLTIKNNQLGDIKREQEAILNDHPVSTASQEQYAQLKSQYEAFNSQLESAARAIENAKGNTSDTAMSGVKMESMKVAEDLASLSTLSVAELLEKGRKGIKAEFDGVILSMPAVEGTSAVQGMELFTLVDTKNLTVKIEVPANDYEKVFKGQRAKIKVGKNEYQGSVISVNQIASSNPTMSGSATQGGAGATIGAVVRIENPDENIIVGVPGKLTLIVAEEKDVLTLPLEVINTNTEGEFVYIVENGIVKEKKIEIGGSSDSKVEILSGLKNGDQVVSDATGDIKEGMKATVKVSK